MTSISHLLQLCLAGGAHSVTLDSDSAQSADALRAKTLALAATLRARPEHTWALWVQTPFEFLACFFALALAKKNILLPGDMQPGTASQLAEHFDALITTATFTSLAKPAFHPDQLRTDTPADFFAPASAEIQLQLYTSGSTGEPKAVPKSLAQLEAELAALQRQWGAEFGQLPVLATVSHQHIYGLLHSVLWPFYRRAPFCNGWFQYPEELCAIAAKHDRVLLISSPTHLKRLPPNKVFCATSGHFAAVVSSAGLLDRDTAGQVAGLLGRAPLEVLGSTETGGIAWRQLAIQPQWRPLPGVVCGRGEQGCLVVKSPHLDPGLGEHGYTMGDRVEFLANGDFELLGRADTLVKVEGKRLSLTAMERHLQDHPWVARARVLLLRGKREETGAVVELSPQGEEFLTAQGKLATNMQLRTHLLQFFERPLLPRRWRYISEWPADTQGKVVMRDLHRLLQGAQN